MPSGIMAFRRATRGQVRSKARERSADQSVARLKRPADEVPSSNANRLFQFARRRPGYAAITGLIIAALLLRVVALGQPQVDVDEQFYLLVGDRMLHGLTPYVDVWDRKPIGLFLIYAAARATGSPGLIQYQLLATISAAATAFAIRVAAPHLRASQIGAWLGGLAYLLWIDLLGGVGGQAPVFFNLPMAIAGMLIVREFAADDRHPKTLVRAGLVSMTLVGIAIQIKYTALFEGIFFGLAFLWLALRIRMPLRQIIAFGCAMVLLALLPTTIAAFYYWLTGHLHDFIFANFLSIGSRLPLPLGEVLYRASTLTLVLVPLMSLSFLGLRFRTPAVPSGQASARRFVATWLGVAVLAVVGLRYFFDHYGLPVAVPAALGAAPILSNWRKIWPYIAGLFATAFIAGQALARDEISSSGGWGTVRAIEKAGKDLRNCPFVYDGPSVVYVLENWCTATRYPFPYHLSYFPESTALGVDALAELARIMGKHPGLVLIRKDPYANENLAARALMMHALKRDYTVVAVAPFHHSALLIFRLKPGIPPERNEVVADPHSP